MKIMFLGACHEVTGSCTCLEVNGRYFLVDCGMEQGLNVFENSGLPASPAEIECVLLTHAHIDHSGKLPWLYKNGSFLHSKDDKIRYPSENIMIG